MLKVHFLVLWVMLHPLGNIVSCAFPFENELRGITELRPLKRWLVFMEIRLWRCTRLASPARLSVYNLLDLLHCTHIHKPQKRCYHIIRYHHYIAIYGNSVHLIAPPLWRSMILPIACKYRDLIENNIFKYSYIRCSQSTSLLPIFILKKKHTGSQWTETVRAFSWNFHFHITTVSIYTVENSIPGVLTSDRTVLKLG